ncbi:hypothetical protein [Sinomicrobium weinanense]|uniref:Uncharacterized protein n=1 Tax=Sinomicrobium weinanense TaxID=2842200 RepID=A0A926JQ31_9FLAO|nr:hypothetical protein [Sinomicrobium weinanense]MBC9795395.1 hypothetical protein [Sinomicrobium weinanense]MBU3122890.1 hypothetical protein [Sinomicrobium weinanense]
MNIKKLKIQPNNGLDSFKIDILKSLNLYDRKKNCLLDFDLRLENYFNRHQNLKVVIDIDEKKLSKNIFKKKFWNLSEYKREIPKGYPFGSSNMETQAHYDPIVCNEKYYKDVERIKSETKEELNFLIINFEKLNMTDHLEIKIHE